MTIARRRQLCLEVTPFYHCVTRCVRRAFLCGRDRYTRRNFNHRRQWIEDHLLLLSHAFCIDIAGYAIMSNHYHVVLHVDSERARGLTDLEVVERWHKLYKGPQIVRNFVAGEMLSDEELELVYKAIAQWREELTNISRFMAHLNESIARRANKEDQCKGRFWESRFRLQAILDLKALLRTLCYVELNPIRAGMADTPERSRFTSVNRRLSEKETGLMRFGRDTDEWESEGDPIRFSVIPVEFKDYLALLDYTSREVRKGKKGFVDANAPSIFMRLGYTERSWANTQTRGAGMKQRAIGSARAMKDYARAIGQRWVCQLKA